MPRALFARSGLADRFVSLPFKPPAFESRESGVYIRRVGGKAALSILEFLFSNLGINKNSRPTKGREGIPAVPPRLAARAARSIARVEANRPLLAPPLTPGMRLGLAGAAAPFTQAARE